MHDGCEGDGLGAQRGSDLRRKGEDDKGKRRWVKMMDWMGDGIGIGISSVPAMRLLSAAEWLPALLDAATCPKKCLMWLDPRKLC